MFPAIGGGSSAVDTGDPIPYSCLLDSSLSQYFSRTFGGSGDRTTNSLSWMGKRGTLGTNQAIMCGSSGQRGMLYFNASDLLTFDAFGVTAYVQFSPVFRDPTAFHNILFVIDTNNAVGADRIRGYLNGIRMTTVAYTTPAQGATPQWNDSVAHYIGNDDSFTRKYGGYFANFLFTGGQALTPSSFGRVSADTGQ